MKRFEQILSALCVGLLPIALGAVPLPIVDVKTFDTTEFESLSPYVLDLAGEWKFYWSGSEARVPENFASETFDAARWETVSVPTCTEALGWGSRLSPGQSISLYRRSFELPLIWEGRKIYLELAGVVGEAFVWVNGKELKPLADGVYEVTGAAGYHAANVLAVKVVRAADSKWSGLCGQVRLFSTPKIELRDFRVTLKESEDSDSAEVEIEADVFKPLDDVSISGIRGVVDSIAKVFNIEGEEIAASPIERLKLSMEEPITTLHQKFTLPSPRLWSAESPASYIVAVQVDHDLRARRVVFKDDSQRDRAILHAIRVSSADFRNGAAASMEEIGEVLSRLKQANFNSVVDGGDLPVRFEAACDYYGLYLVKGEFEGIMSYSELGDKGTASYEEAKFSNSPLKVTCANAAVDRAILKNAHSSLMTSEYYAKWSLTRDGIEITGGTFDPPSTAAGKRVYLTLPLPEADKLDEKGEYLYNLSFLRRNAAPGLPEDCEIMHCQLPYVLPLPEIAAEESASPSEAQAETVVNEERVYVRTKDEGDAKSLEVTAGELKAVFDRVDRKLKSLKHKGKEIFVTDLGIDAFIEGLRGTRIRPGDMRVKGNTIIITDEVLSDGEVGFDRTMTWQFSEDGKIRLELELAPFGMKNDIPGSLGLKWRAQKAENLTFGYFGSGPWANRPGASAAAPVALYSGTSAELSGLRSNVRSLTITGKEGVGIEFKAATPFTLEFGEELKLYLLEPGTSLKGGKWAFDLTQVEPKDAKSSWWIF